MSDVVVGVLCPIPNGAYFGGLFGGINREISAAGGRVVAIQTMDPALTGGFDANIEVPRFDVPIGWSLFQGVISLAESVDGSYLRQLTDLGMPVVTVSREPDGLECPEVLPDNAGGVGAAVEHLLGHGHRRIAFAGHLRQSDIRERYDAYRDVLRRHGLEPDESLFFPTGDNLQLGGYSAGRLLLETGQRPEALIAATDANAIGIIRALREAGWSLPEDLALIGFDGIDEAAQAVPALTTVSVSLDRLGERAAELLLRQIRGEAVTAGRYPIGASMAVRRSCGCLDARESGAPRSSLQVAEGLRGALVPEAEPSPAVRRRLENVVDSVIAFLGTPAEDPAGRRPPEELAAEVHGLGSRPETGRRVLEVLRSYIDALPAAGASRQVPDRRLLDLAMAFGELQARQTAELRVDVKQRMAAHYEVGVALLRSEEEDPTTLSWFGHARAAAGCLGLWSADHSRPELTSELTITGVHGGEAELTALLGRRIPVGSFPPRALIDQMDPAAGDVIHVLPVRSGSTSWGLLAAPANVRSLAVEGREPLNDWAAFLGIALEQRRARHNLKGVYRRERQLAAHLKVSEERYALAARAANDGLWDWNLLEGTVFYSEQWSSTLGLRPAEGGASPEEWLSRVHPDDIEALEQALDDCRDGVKEVLLLEHRVMTADGAYRWMSCRAIGVPGLDGRIARLVGALTDISERKWLEDGAGAQPATKT